MPEPGQTDDYGELLGAGLEGHTDASSLDSGGDVRSAGDTQQGGEPPVEGGGFLVGTTAGGAFGSEGLGDAEGQSADGDAQAQETIDASAAEVLQQVRAEMDVLVTVDIALLVAVFVCAGALCVQTLVKAFEGR